MKKKTHPKKCKFNTLNRNKEHLICFVKAMLPETAFFLDFINDNA